MLRYVEYHGRVNSYRRGNGTWYATVIYFMVRRAVEHDDSDDGITLTTFKKA